MNEHPPMVPAGLDTRALGIIAPRPDAPTERIEAWLATVRRFMKEQPGVEAWPQLMTHAIFALESRKHFRRALVEEYALGKAPR